MDFIQAIIIAIVEGLTEFLPVSSTGHMVLVQNLLSIPDSDFVKAFLVNIQFGAILAVVVVYFKSFFKSLGFYQTLIVAVLPALLIGFFVKDYVDLLLENVWVVAIMLFIGGVFMLFIDKWFAKNEPSGLRKESLQHISIKMALVIGLWQCLAMIPGVSRSMATIVGGLSNKLTRKNATEFSFFLAVPTMAAVALYKLLKDYKVIMEYDNLLILIIGNIAAFLVAMVAIKSFLKFVQKFGFKFFGWYRIVLGATILILLSLGYNLNILG